VRGKNEKQPAIVIDVNEKKRRKRNAEIRERVVNAHVARLLNGRSGARIPAGVRAFSWLQIVQTGSGAPPIFLFSRYQGTFPE